MDLKLDTRPTHSCCAAHAAPAEVGLRAAEDLCQREGVRLTPQRRAVLKALLAARRPLGAYDLIEALREGGARAPAPIVIYRALDFLKDLGLIHRLETLNAFIACPHRHGTHERVSFLICEKCRHVDEVVSPTLNTALDSLAGEHDFRPQRQVVELAGLCRDCQ
ncbi:MAG: transcriptional repressor [Proteobacteria bacterium]|nr:transcriptional repressor [Pseudomonadota bacterium]